MQSIGTIFIYTIFYHCIIININVIIKIPKKDCILYICVCRIKIKRQIIHFETDIFYNFIICYNNVLIFMEKTGSNYISAELHFQIKKL